ncbi:hypothetical protein Scep_020168 [Stephania cephalantha]|uniref:Uncharacterized protein n=1 Tax=Stephania cephalantha TaxID=152367 RepID=A0AAP0IC57_9MAGN
MCRGSSQDFKDSIVAEHPVATVAPFGIFSGCGSSVPTVLNGLASLRFHPRALQRRLKRKRGGGSQRRREPQGAGVCEKERRNCRGGTLTRHHRGREEEDDRPSAEIEQRETREGKIRSLVFFFSSVMHFDSLLGYDQFGKTMKIDEIDESDEYGKLKCG